MTIKVVNLQTGLFFVSIFDLPKQTNKLSDSPERRVLSGEVVIKRKEKKLADLIIFVLIVVFLYFNTKITIQGQEEDRVLSVTFKFGKLWAKIKALFSK